MRATFLPNDMGLYGFMKLLKDCVVSSLFLLMDHPSVFSGWFWSVFCAFSGDTSIHFQPSPRIRS